MMRLEGEPLSCARISEAVRGCERIELSRDALGRIATAHRQVAAVADRRSVYGRSTGVGANRTVAVGDGHGLRLLRSHAAAGGRQLPPDVVRAMLVVRLNQLAAGGSGVSETSALGVVRMLNDDALPIVREHGSVGTGDLAALAGTALTMMGEREATRHWHPVVVMDKHDALPFISSNALTLGRIALAVADLEQMVRASAVVTALSFVAVHGNAEAFSAEAVRATPFTGAAEVAGWMRTLLAGPRPVRSARVQDPFGYRVLPQVHGAVVEVVADLGSAVEALSATAQENPLVVTAATDGDAEVVHHGGFHMAGLVLRLDTARLALAQSAPVLLGRMRALGEPEFTGLEPFLAVGPAGSSGTMILEYVAGSAYGALRAAAAPASLETVVLSRATEEDASFASLGARQLEAAVEAYRLMVACELVYAARAIALREGASAMMPSRPLSEAWDRCLSAGSPAWRSGDFTDRDLQDDLATAEGILTELAGLLPPAAENVLSVRDSSAELDAGVVRDPAVMRNASPVRDSA